ncbi:MAG: hypothetical protein LC789_14710 [Actinobacteria bacterium]|nr:hypothetical protein [Actinomycetota bacterium]MCA1721664.1 hypothetical protein [Actinomycetota bacterium]
MRPYRVVARNIDADADNAIHADDVAQQHGFAGALVPGVELFAYATAPLVEQWGAEFLTGGRIDLRFRRPVLDGEELLVRGVDPLTVTGPDGEVRCVGSAALGPSAPLDLPVAPLPSAPLPEPVLGPMGTVSEPGTAGHAREYLDAVCEPSQLYREQGFAHPGLLLRLVNLVLMRNVALGPWVHTASSCRLHAVARQPAQMQVRGLVTDLYERGGHAYVRYDAVVLADEQPVMSVDHTAIYRLAPVRPVTV